MVANSQAKSVGAVVGENLALEREKRRQTQREAVAYLAAYGLRWTPGAIGQLESGRRESVRLEDLTLLSSAYAVPLSRWFEGAGTVILTDDVRVDRSALRAALSGELVDARTTARLLALRQPGLETLIAMALALGTSEREINKAANQLWGRNLLDERNHRVGPIDSVDKESRRARRGAVTRQLEAELRDHLSRRRPRRTSKKESSDG